MTDFATRAHTKVCNKCGCWDNVHYSNCPKLKLTLSEVTSCGDCPLSNTDGSEEWYCAFPDADVEDFELSSIPAKCPLRKQSLMVMLK